jgi:hypothetical protein
MAAGLIYGLSAQDNRKSVLAGLSRVVMPLLPSGH